MNPIRKALLLSITFIISTTSFGQLTETDKIYSLCKVWGFLKYHHTVVAKGKLDWDAELFKKLDELKPLQTKEEVSKLYLDWITNLGPIQPAKKQVSQPDSMYKYKVDHAWLYDKAMFTDSLVRTLDYVYTNRNQDDNHYVVFTHDGVPVFVNEAVHDTLLFPNKNQRILTLCRYWNCINYFFPHKNIMDENWDTTLIKYIPEFENAPSAPDYYKALRKLAAGTNDSHTSFVNDRYIMGLWGHLFAPAACYLFNDKAIVTKIYNDSLASANNLQYGDVILSIDGKPIAEIIEERKPYEAASNSWTLLRNLSPWLLATKKDSLQLTVERNGNIFTQTIKSYKPRLSNFKLPPDTAKTPWYIRPDGIGYMDMGKFKGKYAPKAFRKLKKTPAIIFDARNYPVGWYWRTSRKINKTKKIFSKFTEVDPHNPGAFRWSDDDFGIMMASAAGKKNKKNYYKGKIVLLVNENTQSSAEYQSMAYQTAPNIITIGGKTAGADGNVAIIPLPGGINVTMTSLGVYYPDKSPTQRCGIKIDIEVYPTIDGIRAHKDEVLDRALEYINIGK